MNCDRFKVKALECRGGPCALSVPQAGINPATTSINHTPRGGERGQDFPLSSRERIRVTYALGCTVRVMVKAPVPPNSGGVFNSAR